MVSLTKSFGQGRTLSVAHNAVRDILTRREYGSRVELRGNYTRHVAPDMYSDTWGFSNVPLVAFDF